MKIWWCAVHKMAAAEPESEEPNDCPAMFLGWMHGKPCQLVPMRLIPDNALVIEGDTAFSIHFEPQEQHYYIEISKPDGETT